MKKIEQLYTSCLAQGAYYIQSKGEAAIIDPLRETDIYLKMAEENGATIKYIFETHFHADFVSGHLDLAKKTGAKIIYGPLAKTEFEKYDAVDGEEFALGDLKIKVLHTPGHTPECSCFLLFDEEGKEHCIFTGDTLFIGDVGRPDLAQKGADLTIEDLAGWLYDSLRNKIMLLPDDIIVYPAHGAGSACGKNMSSDTWSTLGEQKKNNYALRADMTKEEFISEVTDGLAEPPQYFSKNAALNKNGYGSIDEVMEKGVKALSLRSFEMLAEQDDVIILDVRDKVQFVQGFIPNSIFIGLDGSFAPWVGALIEDIQQKIILVAPEGKEAETVKRLARVGYDNALGYLEGGFKNWVDAGKEIDRIETISTDTFIEVCNRSKPLIVDVRKPGEHETTHIEEAELFPLDFINQNHLPKSSETGETLYMHCRSGYRSTVAASILKSRGFHKMINVHGVFDDIKESNVPVSGSCPSLIK